MHWDCTSEDVVPVNITCIQDNPDTVFQITAYNRHVEKIFDVRLIQPGKKMLISYSLVVLEQRKLFKNLLPVLMS